MPKKKKQRISLVDSNGYEIKEGDILTITGHSTIHPKGQSIKIIKISSVEFSKHGSLDEAHVEFINLVTRNKDQATSGFFVYNTSFTAAQILKKLKEEND